MGKKGRGQNNPEKEARKREANKQRAASHLELRWKGAAKKIAIGTNEYAEDMHSFAPFSNLNFFVKNRQNFFAIELMNIH